MSILEQPREFTTLKLDESTSDSERETEKDRASRERRRRHQCARKCGKTMASCVCCIPRCIGGCVKGVFIQIFIFLLVVAALITALVLGLRYFQSTTLSQAQSYVQNALDTYLNPATTSVSSSSVVPSLQCLTASAPPTNPWLTSYSSLYGTIGTNDGHLLLNITMSGLNWPLIQAVGLVSGGQSYLLDRISVAETSPSAIVNLNSNLDCTDTCQLLDNTRQSGRPLSFVLFSSSSTMDAAHALLQAPVFQCLLQ